MNLKRDKKGAEMSSVYSKLIRINQGFSGITVQCLLAGLLLFVSGCVADQCRCYQIYPAPKRYIPADEERPQITNPDLTPPVVPDGYFQVPDRKRTPDIQNAETPFKIRNF